MLEQPLPMSSALRASARSLGFLMGYKVIYNVSGKKYTIVYIFVTPANSVGF